MLGAADWVESDRHFSFLTLVCIMFYEVWVYIGLDMRNMTLLLSIFAIIFYGTVPFPYNPFPYNS